MKTTQITRYYIFNRITEEVLATVSYTDPYGMTSITVYFTNQIFYRAVEPFKTKKSAEDFLQKYHIKEEIRCLKLTQDQLTIKPVTVTYTFN